ncbi:MAG: hypothetical protein BM557_08205 [Flavobacterium sp. MedPE-SWcel]|uniref:hypothetical protein n=1 Tax=uncultured Flavobacterium sp. TaxID=165435 RepID=UPI00092071C1|nr:hypothetical protein [uncultured Flavobacterium sp.]OIQ17662.1 MAG: hypothetical protein BM557_08205 [Flavobacterium sp. MedPE-SWcel]
MKPQIKYIELKTGFSDNGPAWIGLITFSKSGKTIYFNGKAFQSLNGNGVFANYFDIETGDEYWISGAKKSMSDRHSIGAGKIFVEKRIINNYLKIINQQKLNSTLHEPVDNIITEIPKKRINELENQTVETNQLDDNLYFRLPVELTDIEIKHLIKELIIDEENSQYNKARRSIKQKRILLEEEAKKRDLNLY